MKILRSLKKIFHIQVSGPDDVPPVWGFSRRSFSDQYRQPDFLTGRSPTIRRPNMKALPPPTVCISSWSGFQQLPSRSLPKDRPNMEALPPPTGITSIWSGFLRPEIESFRFRMLSSMSGFLQPDLEAPTGITSIWSGFLRLHVEADPQPTESTSSWSGSLQPDSYDKEKSSEDYYRVVEKQRKIEKKRSLKKMIQILFSGSDDVKTPLEQRKQSIEGGPCRRRSLPIDRPDMEADPQPTQRTSSMSGSLRPEMGRIRTSSSDGEFRPDMEADPQTTG